MIGHARGDRRRGMLNFAGPVPAGGTKGRTSVNTATVRPRRFLSRPDQAKRYRKSVRTIKRWGADPKMGMPPEYDFNGPHRDEAELEDWEQSRVAMKD